MRYEAPIRAVETPGRLRTARAILAGAGLVVAIAVGTSAIDAGTVRPAALSPSAATHAGVVAVAATGVPETAPSVRPRPIPADLDCNDLDRAACLRIARAALSALPPDAPRVTSASAWRSLLCNDTLDCPARYLDRSEPLGSVVVAFADRSPAAAVNVVDWRFGPNVRLGTRAWLLDWSPPAPGG
jgi:hypothetical protein